MLCRGCYELWLRNRPVGAGASCISCADRRQDHLRYYELPASFVVLCHNCCACAMRFVRPPKSEEGLLERLQRDRRQGERRLKRAPNQETVVDRRRRGERRIGLRDIFDATELAVIEEGGQQIDQAALDETRAALSELKREIGRQEPGEVTSVFDLSEMTRVRPIA